MQNNQCLVAALIEHGIRWIMAPHCQLLTRWIFDLSQQTTPT
jgi:hypothetical protein